MQEVRQHYRFKDMVLIPFKSSFWHSTVMVILTILNGIVPILQIIAMTRVINTAVSIVQDQISITEVYVPILYMILLIAYQWLSEELSKFSKTKISLEIRTTFRTNITEKVAKLNYHNIENNEKWDLISRVQQKLEEQIANTFINVLGLASLIINIVGVLYVIFTYVWWAAVLVVILMIPLCYLATRGAKQTYNAERDISEVIRKYEYLSEVLTGRESAEERSLFAFTDKLNKDYQDTYDIAYKVRLKTRRAWFLKMKAGSLVVSTVSVLIIFIFLNPVLTGQISSGFFIAIVKGIFSLIQKMSWGLTYYVDQLATHNEYFKDLNMLLNLDEAEGATDLPAQTTPNFESIEFKDVYFKYPKTDKYILNGMNFKIEKDKHYAFVGVNGAGKTTIIKLISGLYKDYEGSILINSKELKNHTQAEIKSFVSVLYQDFAKYQITLKDNITIGNINEHKSDKMDKKLSNIIESIGLEKAVKGLAEGVDTPLGKIKENGQELSGGQWQRVAIARCLVNPSPIKILDEPTAALDPISESELYQKFNSLTSDSTTILISHRLGSTKLADEIFVVGEGKLIEKGTHQELMEQEGIYSEMYNSQKDWYVL